MGTTSNSTKTNTAHLQFDLENCEQICQLTSQVPGCSDTYRERNVNEPGLEEEEGLKVYPDRRCNINSEHLFDTQNLNEIEIKTTLHDNMEHTHANNPTEETKLQNPSGKSMKTRGEEGKPEGDVTDDKKLERKNSSGHSHYKEDDQVQSNCSSENAGRNLQAVVKQVEPSDGRGGERRDEAESKEVMICQIFQVPKCDLAEKLNEYEKEREDKEQEEEEEEENESEGEKDYKGEEETELNEEGDDENCDEDENQNNNQNDDNDSKNDDNKADNQIENEDDNQYNNHDNNQHENQVHDQSDNHDNNQDNTKDGNQDEKHDDNPEDNQGDNQGDVDNQEDSHDNNQDNNQINNHDNNQDNNQNDDRNVCDDDAGDDDDDDVDEKEEELKEMKIRKKNYERGEFPCRDSSG